MRALAHGDGRGGALNRDDRNALRFLYPLTGPVGPVGPAAPADLTVTAISQTALELHWQDRSGNETGFEIHERMVGQRVHAHQDTAGEHDVRRHSRHPAGDLPRLPGRRHEQPRQFEPHARSRRHDACRRSRSASRTATRSASTRAASASSSQWESAEDAGAGAAVPLTNDTGYSWFFNEDNVEVVVKVLDGCDFNQRYWVFRRRG